MYRDDLEAALARADDLEKELARAREELSVDEDKIARLERDLAEARKRAKAAPAPPAATATGKAKSPRAVLIVLGVAVALGAAGVAFSTMASSSTNTSPAPSPSKTPSPEAGELFDVSVGYGQALAMARRTFPDAELLRIEAQYVDEQGRAHFKYNGEVRYRFRSPSRAAAPPPPNSEPLGAPQTRRRPFCRLSVYAYKDHALRVSNGNDGDTDCGGESIPPPRCTVAAVWARARAQGAPGGAIAEIDLDGRGWRLAVNSDRGTVFAGRFADDCAP